MSRMAQFILALIVGLALLTWAASGVVQTTADEWFERDIGSRARLVLVGANQSLANAWYGESGELEKRLQEISQDENVLGVAACNADLTPRNSTPRLPEEFDCRAVGSRVRSCDTNDLVGLQDGTPSNLPTGRVHVNVMPITNED